MQKFLLSTWHRTALRVPVLPPVELALAGLAGMVAAQCSALLKSKACDPSSNHPVYAHNLHLAFLHRLSAQCLKLNSQQSNQPQLVPSQTAVLTLLTALQVEEFYVIVWEAKKEQIFEMPTGGAAMMRQGPNLLKLARKEQCIALLQQLRNKFRTDGQIHRVFPSECAIPGFQTFVFVCAVPELELHQEC